MTMIVIEVVGDADEETLLARIERVTGVLTVKVLA